MTPTRREGIRMMIEAAKRNHAKRSHLHREHKWATVELLQHECGFDANHQAIQDAMQLRAEGALIASGAIFIVTMLLGILIYGV